MATSNTDDQGINPFTLPFTTMRSMRDAILESWATIATDAVNTDLFAQILGMYLNTTLTSTAPVQRVVDQYMQALLPRLSLPSRSEVTTIAGRLTNIELRLDDLDARLDQLVQPASSAANINTASIDARLQAIETRLEALLAASQQSKARAPTTAKRRTPARKREASE